jgi:hypothetical protein
MDAFTFQLHHGPGALFGHDARQGFCPVCGAVAPCYRARRAQALGPRSTGCAAAGPAVS